jgi:hypothetical protein
LRRNLSGNSVLSLVLALELAVLALGTPVAAGTIVINNGLSPPNPANTIEASNSFPDDSVFVQNVGCDATVQTPCDSPGSDTTVALGDGGIALAVNVWESSTFIMSGGSILFGLESYDSSTITLAGGSVGSEVRAFNSSTIVISGGSVFGVKAGGTGSMVEIHGGSIADYLDPNGGTIAVFGSGFAIDGGSVPFGPIAALSGNLTGTLASGDGINNPFIINPGSGQIILVPEPPTALLLSVGLLGLLWREFAITIRASRGVE